MVIAGLSNETWRQICEAYKISTKATVVPLNISKNITYQISLPGGVKQILRLYYSGTKIEWLQSELSVLAYLRRETDLNILQPIAAQNGQLFTTLYKTNKHKPTQAAIFSFVSGEIVDGIISQEMMFLIGQTLGQLDLSLHKADSAIDPSPSEIRPRWHVRSRIDWSLSVLVEHQTDFKFLNDDTSRKRLHPKILSVAKRLQRHLRKLQRFLPHQLLHADANLTNLVFDGARIGLIDFDDMCYGPRIWELVAPLHNVYVREVLDISTYTNSLPLLTEALLDGYMKYIAFSEIELHSFSLIQALRLFGGLGWEVSLQHSPQEREILEQTGAVKVNQISDLIKTYENNLILNRFQKPKFWMTRVAKVWQ